MSMDAISRLSAAAAVGPGDPIFSHGVQSCRQLSCLWHRTGFLSFLKSCREDKGKYIGGTEKIIKLVFIPCKC